MSYYDVSAMFFSGLLRVREMSDQKMPAISESEVKRCVFSAVPQAALNGQPDGRGRGFRRKEPGYARIKRRYADT